MNKKQTVILGGGTFYHIRNHLSLAAPAFGTTAKYLHKKLPDSFLYLTKMADSKSKLVTNKDIENFIDELILDKNIGTIILNVALCDFEADWIGNIPNGPHADRLKTSDGGGQLEIYPADKLINKIRIKRPDIFLVGFKTTTNAMEKEQYYTALQFMKKTKCNLVLANDTVTRNNMVVVPEEAYYFNTQVRNITLHGLVELIEKRQNLTYHRTNFKELKNNIDMEYTPPTFKTVIRYLIDNGGFICDNGNGFTPGHFCFKLNENSFLSSQRKANHNNVFDVGLTKITTRSNNIIIAKGTAKPSVGFTSQKLLFKACPQFDCIVHTHNPLKVNSKINRIPQFAYQCGSIECGHNTLSGLKFYGNIGAVYLTKHGINILFNSADNPQDVIEFINNNIKLGSKVT